MSASKLLAALLAVLLFAAGINASQIIIPKRDISFDYTVEPVPKLGEDFTVTVTFELNEDIYYTAESEYGVIALIGVVPRQEFINGDTIMTGKFAKGEPKTISATYRATKGTLMSIGLTVKTSGADTLGGWPYYACNSTTFKEYRIAEEKVIPGKTYTDTATGIKFTVIPEDSLKIPVTDKYGRPLVITKEKDQYNEGNVKNSRPSTRIKEIPLVLNDTLVYEQTRILRISEQRDETLVFRDINTDRILIPIFADSVHELGTITHRDDSTFLFTPANKTGEAVFLGEIDGQPFELKIFFVIKMIQ